MARSLNEWFLVNPTGEQFFTLVYGVLDVPALRLRYVSAGHPLLLLTHADSDPQWLPSTGVPIGIVAEAEFEEKVVSLKAGDRLLLYSDGITEAHNPSGEMFGAGRLHRLMLNATALPLETLLQDILKGVLDWSQDRAHDDLSLLALAVTGKTKGDCGSDSER